MSILTTADDYTIAHVVGETRKAVQRIFEAHYMGSEGGSGYCFALMAPDGTVVGGVLIGPASSMGAERAIVQAPHRVWCLKRSFILDHLPGRPDRPIPVPESQLIRFAMREVASKCGETVVMVSYADPCAVDARTGRPLLGWTYFAAGFFYAGLTSQPRYAVIDEHGRARSSRQGAITLSKSNIALHRPGWQICRVPPARVWLAVVTPETLTVDGVSRATTRAWCKRQWKRAWASLVPSRRVAARQWIAEATWCDAVRDGQVALGPPHTLRYRLPASPAAATPYVDVPGATPLEAAGALLVQRSQAALWQGAQLSRTAAPVWVPHIAQAEIGTITEAEIAGERTAGRQYAPRLRAAV